MLPKNRRISRKEFPYILKTGKRLNSPSLLLYITPIVSETKPKESRFSFSVSKKTCPKAVERNKHRRRGYSIILKKISNIKSGYYCFFSFKRTIKPVTFFTLEKEVYELLSISNMLI